MLDDKLTYLLGIGFQPAGAWSNLDRRIAHDIPMHHGVRRNVLYAFAVNEHLVYVGRTTIMLKERMRRYAHPPKSAHNGGGTNIKNNRNILAELQAQRRVLIFFLPGLHSTEDEPAPSGSRLFLLEEELRAKLAPPWNDV